MGHHSHHIVRCHRCKRRRALGGSKKTGRFADAERGGWAFIPDTPRSWVWLCPTCDRKRHAVRA